MVCCKREALVVSVCALSAFVLVGCGSGASSVVPDDATIQYFRAPDHAKIKDFKPECDFWRPEDLAKKVPDQCCDVSAWPGDSNFSSTPPDARSNPFDDQDQQKYACYVRERAPPNTGSYVRNAFACENDMLQLTEGCAPEGLSMGNGYPMNADNAKKNQELVGDSETCNCDVKGRYVGAGCFVALSGFIAGVSPDPTANFVKLAGSPCGTRVEYF